MKFSLKCIVIIAFAITASASVEPGPRPRALIDSLPVSALKSRLEKCGDGPFKASDFVIAHRGAPLGYPEHTRQGYIAAAKMGAGLIECDVTFTRDGHLVCRHSQCDLHRTTNILKTPVARNCTEPFTPASSTQPATAKCCTSDITLAEFKSLCGRADFANPQARSISAYLPNRIRKVDTPVLICPTLLTHKESIDLIGKLGRKYVPELKAPMVKMPFNGMTQNQYADRLIQAYLDTNTNLSDVYPQSFNITDIKYWIETYPEIAHQVVYLDPRGRSPDFKPTLAGMRHLYDLGLRILAPPIPMLVRLNGDEIVPTAYARLAQQAGLKLIAWTFESGEATDPKNWLYYPVRSAIKIEADMLRVLEVLERDVGIIGLFTDWAGTVTYYNACSQQQKGLKH